MAKKQIATDCYPKITDVQRLNRICSILSFGVMRRIQAQKITEQHVTQKAAVIDAPIIVHPHP